LRGYIDGSILFSEGTEIGYSIYFYFIVYKISFYKGSNYLFYCYL